MPEPFNFFLGNLSRISVHFSTLFFHFFTLFSLGPLNLYHPIFLILSFFSINCLIVYLSLNNLLHAIHPIHIVNLLIFLMFKIGLQFIRLLSYKLQTLNKPLISLSKVCWKQKNLLSKQKNLNGLLYKN